MSESGVFRWVIAAVVVVGIVCMLAYRRNDPGVGGRVPDPEDVVAVVVVDDTP
jgi:hypothetical protein